MSPAPYTARLLNRWMEGVGIRGRLLLVVLAMGLPFVGYLSISSVMQLVTARQYAHRMMQSAAQFTAARLDDHLGNLRVLVATIAGASSADPADAGRNSTLLRTLMPDLTGRIHTVSLWSQDGTPLGSSSERAAAAWTPVEQALARRALAQEELVAQTDMRSPAGPVVMFAQAVPRPGHASSVIIATILLEQYHRRLLGPDQRLPAGAVVTVMDSEGIVLARSADPQRWVGQPSGATAARVAELRRLAPGTHEASSLEGHPRILGFATANTMPLLVWVGIPVDTVLAAARGRLVQSVAVGLGLLAVALTMALGAGRAIARPLQELSEDATRLGGGDLSHRHRVSGMPEIGQLARTLNDMADALQTRTRLQQQTEAMLREITDNLPALISMVDREGVYLFANSPHRTWFGQDSQILGRRLGDVLGRSIVETLRTHLDRALAGERTSLDFRAAVLGTQRWVQVTMVPRRDETGQVCGLYLMTVDTSERRAAELQLARSEQRLTMALEASGLALFDWDVAARRTYYSSQSSVMLGGPQIDIVVDDRSRLEAVHPQDQPLMIDALGRLLKGQVDSFRLEYRVRNLQGDWVWILGRGRVVERDADGHATRVAGTDANITEHKLAEQRLRQLAEHDHLTGLPNRALFMDRLLHAVARALRHRTALAVMYVDIDHFKHVNDTLGHAAGDTVLTVQAGRLAARIRRADTVARLSGDEFTVILEDLNEPGGAQALAHDLVQAAREPITLANGTVLRTTISVGLAFWAPEDAPDGTTLLRRADDALYEAKRRGRDQYAEVRDQDDTLRVDGTPF